MLGHLPHLVLQRVEGVISGTVFKTVSDPAVHGPVPKVPAVWTMTKPEEINPADALTEAALSKQYPDVVILTYTDNIVLDPLLLLMINYL